MAAAGNNMFAITCGLLQQYMRPELKHKQSAPQMGVLASSSQSLLPLLAEEATNDARTMQLFPRHAGTSQPSEKQPPEEHAKKAPLTIFYEGQVLVFEGFPADRAKELMQLAGSGSSAALKNEAPVVPEDTASIKPSPPLPSVDLPIARKASLKRFLQKRKQRIIATDPYQKETTPGKEATEGKPVNGEPAASWLAL